MTMIVGAGLIVSIVKALVSHTANATLVEAQVTRLMGLNVTGAAEQGSENLIARFARIRITGRFGGRPNRFLYGRHYGLLSLSLPFEAGHSDYKTQTHLIKIKIF